MGSKTIKWDITNRCNLRCAHCSVGKMYFSGDIQEITLADKLAIVDKLAAGSVSAVSLLGGEPLLLKEDLFQVLDRLKEHQIRVSMVTNGTLLNDNNITKLLDYGVDRIVISLEGAQAQTHETVRGKGTFQRVTGNIRRLTQEIQWRGCQTQVSINTVINRLNYLEIDQFFELCKVLGVNEWSVLSLLNTGFAEDNTNVLAISPEQEIEVARKIACWYASQSNDGSFTVSPQIYPLIFDYIEAMDGLQMPRQRICCSASIGLGFIAPDGSLLPCDRFLNQSYLGFSIRGAIAQAQSLVDQSFYEIWNSDYFVHMLPLIWEEQTYQDYNPCFRCKYFFSRQCIPCPLYSLDSRVEVKSCLIAEQALGDISGGVEFTAMKEQITRTANFPQKDVNAGISLFNQLCFQVPVKRSGVRFATLRNSELLLNPYTVEYIMLEPIGQLAWELVDGNRNLQELHIQFQEIVLDTLRRIQADATHVPDLSTQLAAFFNSLYQKGFIEWNSAKI